jgi:NADH:ubiquinone oxidoreductase subunit
MRFINDFLIKLAANEIGADEFGNRYFLHKKNNKRFVIYNGVAEPSKVPMDWHAWLHYTTNKIPNESESHKFSWQKIHLPNLTGTKNAHQPKNTTNQHYQAWKPE